MKEIWDKMRLLAVRPELADTPGYELAELRKTAPPVEWFFLLAVQPMFAPEKEWWEECQRGVWLPWAQLLAAHEEFERFCRWETVSRLELVKLAFRAPELFRRRFPQGRWYDLYAFLTPLEKMILLSDVPEAESEVDWDSMAEELDDGLWLMLLAYQPQFERYFDWSRVEGKRSVYWASLLAKQPQFADHCDFALLDDRQRRKILRHQPQLAERFGE